MEQQRLLVIESDLLVQRHTAEVSDEAKRGDEIGPQPRQTTNSGNPCDHGHPGVIDMDSDAESISRRRKEHDFLAYITTGQGRLAPHFDPNGSR